MKKQLLIGSALLLAFGAYSQSNKHLFQPNGMINMAEKLASQQAILNSANGEKPVTNMVNKSSNPGTSAQSNNSSQNAASSPIVAATFTMFSGSMNVFGMLVSHSKPLQYNRYLRAYSFVQRKSATYVTNPVLPANAQSGAIVAMIGKDDGASWDATLLYADANNWSRYPQGGIYNPLNGSVLDNAYVVGTGPITQANTALGWIGSWHASKKITSPGTNSVGVDVQFFANSGGNYGSTTSPAMTKHDMPRYSFSSTDDGIVRSAGELLTDVNGTTYATQKFRGAHISKGIFTAGVMVWTADSMVPPLVQHTTDNYGIAFGTPYMAWNDAGTVGYVMIIGCRQGSTLSNKGYQPIVYKTTNSGNVWNLVNGIDFNAPAATIPTYDLVLNSMNGVNTNTNMEVPMFNAGEGIDMVVDKNNKLHIVSTVVGSARAHTDSIGYTWQYPKGTENMSWPYVKTAWPYLFDFSGDGSSAWEVKVIDSLGTEGPSDVSGNAGFGSNPWANQSQANPVASSDRIQVSRSYDGEFLTYSWAESDTTLTTNTTKWNEFPNIHQRALRLCDGAVSTDEFLISSPSTGFNPRVRDKAYFHYMGSTCKAGASTPTSATFTVPYTVTNNLTADGGVSVDHFFSSAVVIHNFPSAACGGTLTTGISAAKTEASQSSIFPNPTKNNVNVSINLSQAKDISVDVYNAIGQMISSVKTNGQTGENLINVNLNNASAGVYFVKIKAGSSESTKKLIVE